ncbi:MAG: hypothetical protein A2138_00415 [Deltaproteobacteria bacterium RBG_16_71_12]|nr:MAG: hypothetical protein A2138_00415 [Deltaproteobacteria bacterium RBG_16_71_12]
MTTFRRLVASATAALLLGAPALAQDDFGFTMVEEQVTDTDKQRIEDAKDLVAQERYADALSAYEGILADAKLNKYHEAASYDVCKAYYKMGAFHASLACFQGILEDGPKHTMYAQSREWLFFSARKIKDELAALEPIARFVKAGEIPAEYQSELSFSLGRYYFLVALELGAKGVESEEKSLDEAKEQPEAPLEFEAGDADKKEEPKKEEKPAEEEGGFDFSSDDGGGGDVEPGALRLARAQDDGFDFGDVKVKDDKKKGKGKAKPKGKDEKKGEAAAAPPPPPPKPTHTFEGPRDPDSALKLALENLSRVKPEYERYAQAVYIKGLVHFTRGEFEPSVKQFREVVRLTNPRGGTVKNDRLRELAFFSLARIHYQFEQFRYAIFYYDRVSRDSEAWLEALFESSWAHFRLGEYQKALGNLVTLQSPFFQDEYYPEAAILKAITFYENCRYPEARAFLGEFEQSYGGVLAELKRLIGEGGGGEAATGGAKGAKVEVRSAESLFDELTQLEAKVADGQDDKSGSYAMTARLVRLALSDKRVRGYREAIEEVDSEKALLDGLDAPYRGGKLHGEAMQAIEARRAALVSLAGTVLRDKLTAEKAFLEDLTGKLLRIRFEITKGEKESDEAALQGSSQTVVLGAYDDTTATDDERLYWPFQGEYWRDELGTYQYTLTRGCRPATETTITGN